MYHPFPAPSRHRLRLRGLLLALAAAGVALAAAFAVGFAVAPRDLLDSEVRHTGFFGADRSRILSTTVSNLRAEGRLVVYSYKGSTEVEIERSRLFGLLNGRQRLSVPGTVSYHLDLSDLGMEDVRLDERSRTLFVALPPLQLGEIALAPDHARLVNDGWMTIRDDVVQDMARENYRQARRALIAQAQQPAIAGLARRQAAQLVTAHLELPLRAAGLTDVQVRAHFPDDRANAPGSDRP